MTREKAILTESYLVTLKVPLAVQGLRISYWFMRHISCRLFFLQANHLEKSISTLILEAGIAESMLREAKNPERSDRNS